MCQMQLVLHALAGRLTAAHLWQLQRWLSAIDDILQAATLMVQAVAADVGNSRTAQQVLQRCTRRGLVVDIRKGAWDSKEDASLLQVRCIKLKKTMIASVRS